MSRNVDKFGVEKINLADESDIEITPEMIEAGRKSLYQVISDDELGAVSVDDFVCDLYSAMRDADCATDS